MPRHCGKVCELQLNWFFLGAPKIGEGFSGFKSPAFGFGAGSSGSVAEALTAFAEKEKEKEAAASGISG